MTSGPFRLPPRLRARLPELLLAAGATLAVLGLVAGAEAVARAADPRYLDRERSILVYSEAYGWLLRPGYRGFLHDVWTTVDSRGHRGREHTLACPPGRSRLVVLGDSIAFGSRARDEEIFCALLETRSGVYDVINLAVEGYGTDQELLRLEGEGLAYRPDAVVLSFALANDVHNNASSNNDPRGSMPKPWFSLEGDTLVRHDEHVRLSPLRRVSQWLQDDSHLYNRLFGAPAVNAPPPGGASAPQVRLDRPAARQVTLALLRRANAVARGAGARLLVLLQPDESAFYGRLPFAPKLRESLRQAGIPFVDLAGRWRSAGLGFDAVCLDQQGHLTPLGHHFTAEETEAALADLGIGPGARRAQASP
jgi:hypothetical protein